jgi:four helix bundle protein
MLAEKLADEIWNLVREWDRFAQDTVGRQIVRAAESIGANIAEGTGQGRFPDNRRFVRTARASLNGRRTWLQRAHSRHLLKPEITAKIKPIIDELSPKPNAYLQSIGDTPESEVRSGRRIGNEEQRTTDNGRRTQR